jgi:hypothetical protein
MRLLALARSRLRVFFLGYNPTLSTGGIDDSLSDSSSRVASVAGR